MIYISTVVGASADPEMRDRLHRVEHEGVVDVVTVAADDLSRRRLMARTSGGEEVAITLPRDQKLFDGAVLLLESDRAIVVRSAERRWLRLSPRNAVDALELGYHAGNLHWRVRFDAGDLLVACDGPTETYAARIEALLASGRVKMSEEAQ